MIGEQMGALAAAYRPSKRSVATDGQCPVWASTICQYCLVVGLSHLAAHADRSARSAATRFPVQLQGRVRSAGGVLQFNGENVLQLL